MPQRERNQNFRDLWRKSCKNRRHEIVYTPVWNTRPLPKANTKAPFWKERVIKCIVLVCLWFKVSVWSPIMDFDTQPLIQNSFLGLQIKSHWKLLFLVELVLNKHSVCKDKLKSRTEVKSKNIPTSISQCTLSPHSLPSILFVSIDQSMQQLDWYVK